MKKLPVLLSILLIIALCLSLAACSDEKETEATEAATTVTEPPQEPVKNAVVGDTFVHSGRTITLTEISEDAGKTFSSAGDPVGKWIVFTFSIADGDSPFNITCDGFSLNGRAASTAIGIYKNGAIAQTGSSLRTTSELTFAILFDADIDTSMDQLGLKVTM